MKKKHWIILVSLAALAAMFLHYAYTVADTRWRAMPFDRHGWDTMYRSSMIAYFQIHQNELLGLNRYQILQKLGNPQKCGNKSLGYKYEVLFDGADEGEPQTGAVLSRVDCYMYSDRLNPIYRLVVYFDKPAADAKVEIIGGHQVHPKASPFAQPE